MSYAPKNYWDEYCRERQNLNIFLSSSLGIFFFMYQAELPTDVLGSWRQFKWKRFLVWTVYICSRLLHSISEPTSEEQPPCSAEPAFSEGRLMAELQLRRKHSKLNRSAAGTLHPCQDAAAGKLALNGRPHDAKFLIGRKSKRIVATSRNKNSRKQSQDDSKTKTELEG